MKLCKLFVLVLSLALSATGCLNDHDSSSGQPTTVAAAPSTTSGGTTESSSSSGLIVSDPLTNGTSSGIVAGGNFTAAGYYIGTNNGGYIMYPTNIIGNIRVEFDASGYLPNEDAADSKLTVIELYDSAPYANWKTDWASIPAYLYQLRKRGAGGSYTNALDLKYGSAYYNTDHEMWGWYPDYRSGQPLEWDPAKTYHWVVTISGGVTEVYRDGFLYYSENCSLAFAPKNPIVVRIGGTSYGAYGPRNVTYSNVKIYDL
ncbi:hypothetical protein CSA56_01460 [candidate division KSB3 bacterium]|uniref:3-keto-disaccharide hydrolase domain-containing protein n=1 Tax=candidate division KSB3 bacterium TaxID=2044937 RepID=A0A2G6KKB2_9BACT|nr:MAG: hypothetical protein CSA56_01460 [candidate division KSB3 bacterium]